jgi:hypothetical protein
MGKHGSDFPRVERDFYPTPGWVVDSLAEQVDLAGKTIWECACGDGRMATALGRAGARVYCSDIVDRGYSELNELLDFTSGRNPKLARFDGIITNPPGGVGNKLAVAFVASGLRRINANGFLALLLPVDFDSGVTRRCFFADCPAFTGKIVLTKRIKWFERADGKRADPKENHAWFLWAPPTPLHVRQPVIAYAPRMIGMPR